MSGWDDDPSRELVSTYRPRRKGLPHQANKELGKVVVIALLLAMFVPAIVQIVLGR